MQKEVFMARLLEGVQIQFKPLEEVQRSVIRRSRIAEEDKDLIRQFIEGLKSGVHQSFVVPVEDTKQYAKIKRLIKVVAEGMVYPVTAAKHPQGIAVWAETVEDVLLNTEMKEAFREGAKRR
jgi:hypothetical protein